ncbi:expressed unknown protein [Seminavis robusta]|uniref:Uncharacterized protein n=1 Tax=Seminavis robusta TaxID=568900 RepID=A0A9N8DAT8_9STRA|nr:expressed unknown protein [Seminavis robusta]|eukprot:Sro19_g013200.1 n/a (202) ;mRNA; r:10872-11566
MMRSPWWSVVMAGLLLTPTAHGLSLYMSGSKEIYGVRNSGWKSPQWNWGYAQGTGHDCAAICRRQWSTMEARQELVENLLEPAEDPESRRPKNFEEVKLVLGLAWQRGRWDGSDGGSGGYGDVLRTMAEAKRYEDGTDDENALRLVEDMQCRFDLLADNTSLELREMRALLDGDAAEDMDYVQRQCSGLVLEAMGFIEKGL